MSNWYCSQVIFTHQIVYYSRVIYKFEIVYFSHIIFTYKIVKCSYFIFTYEIVNCLLLTGDAKLHFEVEEGSRKMHERRSRT
jgi:hypothetical protein